MYHEKVVKRDGSQQNADFNKVLNRIRGIAGQNIDSRFFHKPLNMVNCDYIAKKVISSIHNGISTAELDEIAAQIAQPMLLQHPEYEAFASRIFIDNYKKNQEHLLSKYENHGSKMLNVYNLLWNNRDKAGKQRPIIGAHVLALILEFPELENIIQYDRDYDFDYSGFLILQSKYLLKAYNSECNGVAIELPQQLYFRVSASIWLEAETNLLEKHEALLESMDWNSAWDTLLTQYRNLIKSFYTPEKLVELKKHIKTSYDALSLGKMTHATPTLFNAGTCIQQLSSCFLAGPQKDSLDAIFDWIKESALISKYAGGIGSHISLLRPAGQLIGGTGGTSSGVHKALQPVDATSGYVDQGGDKRPGSHAIYIELWHGDVMEFIHMKNPKGSMETTCRNLFTALWISDEFMRSLQAGKTWYLMDLNTCTGLMDLWDKVHRTSWISDEEIFNSNGSVKQSARKSFAFTSAYREYARQGKFISKIEPSQIWNAVCKLSQESGLPYLCFKDSANRKNAQKNIGAIYGSNLCTEIYERHGADEIAVCNLASICLPKFITSVKPEFRKQHEYPEGWKTNLDLPEAMQTFVWFDFHAFQKTVRNAVYALDRVIDVNFYPVQRAKNSNMRHRPIGLGVQGLADVFASCWLCFDSPEAIKLDRAIFQSMYFAACKASCKLARAKEQYSSFPGSPTSKGKLQPDLWKSEHEASDRSNFTPDFSLHYDFESLKMEIAAHGIRNSLLIAPMPTGTTSSILNNSPCFEPYNALFYKRKDGSGENIKFCKPLVDILISRGLWTPEIRDRIISDRTSGIQSIEEIPQEIRSVFKSAWDIGSTCIIDHAVARAPFIDQGNSMSWFIADPTSSIINKLTYYAWRRGLKTGRYYLRRLAPAEAKKLGVDTIPESGGGMCSMQEGCITCSA